ncbi:MAG: universal stress protein [Solirubrobacteraceae bacterium]
MTANADSPSLICYDGSMAAKHAIRCAAALPCARRAVVLTVWEPTAGLGSFAWSGATESTLDYVELDRTAAELGGRIVEEGARIAQHAGIQAQPVAAKAAGPGWKTILKVAADHEASTIVIGSRGLTGMRSMLLGSVFTAVVHHADRPTLVIHRPGDAHADADHGAAGTLCRS